MSRYGYAHDATTLPIRVVETWYTSEWAVEAQIRRDKIAEQKVLAEKYPRPRVLPIPPTTFSGDTRYVGVEPEMTVEEYVESEFAA